MTTQLEQPRIVRSRISHKLAFPVGFELLREHFGALLPWPEVRLSFLPHPTVWASEFAQILREGKPYCILRVERRSATEDPSPEPAHWHFTIYPVPRDLKSIARTALISAAAPPLRDFISRVPTYWTYYNRVDVIFDPTERTCRTDQLWEI